MANRNTRHVEINFDASMDIQDIRSALKTIQDGFDGLNLPENISKKLVKDLSKLKDELDNFEGLSGGMQNLEDIGKAERSLKKILELYSKLNIETKELSSIEIKNLLPDNIKANINSATKAFDSYKKSIKEIETQAAVTGKRLEELRILKEEATKIKTTRTKAANALRTFEEEDTKNNTRSKLSSELEAARLSKSNFKKTHKEETDYLSEDFLKIEARIKAAEKALRDYDSTYKTLQDTYSDADKALTRNLKSQENYNDLQKEYGESLKKIKEALTSLGEQEKNQAFESLKKQLSEIEGFDVDNLKADLSNFNSLIENLSDDALKDLRKSLDLVDNGLDQTGQAASRASNNLDKIEESAESIAKTSDEIANLKNRILDFFSIGNAVQIFQNSIERAFQSVKELDAAMTETAVVTDFSVGDMWEALPQYSSIARELGTTTLDVYEATTLLYQQGLQTNEVMEAGTEILKFARIAGLDAADATNFMTAAIRGFNMEMNEVNTKRVNDVYSELAAITASDTEQISVAVSKTASLAKNAGMELETTAAMLAQVIETTQEAPETAGTALKTIIARFQELKKDPLEMEEIDGEVVDANKIESALRSVGVALRDTTGQFRDLDDVFLELSSKWNTLDKNQQRYIATVAAGSRQQSRFIAMMSDYERTMELVDAANNSAGSSQEQFDKTLESLQSKLNKLSDAWQLFTMGIMNSEFVKGGVDLLTNILTAVNDLTGSFGDLGTLISRVGLIIGSLVIGKKVFTKLSSGVTELFEGISKHYKEQTIKSRTSGEEAGRAYGQGMAQGIANERQNIQNAMDYAMGNTNSMPALIRPVGQIQTKPQENNNQTPNVPLQNNNVFKKGINTVNQKFESKSFEEMTISMSKAALASEGVAMGLSAISMALDANGIDKGAKAFQNFSTAASGLGVVLQTLPVILKTIGVTSTAALGWVGVAITAITLIGTAIYTAIDAIETEEEKLERLNSELELFKENYKNVKEELDNLDNARNSYNEMQNSLQNLNRGTKEWTEALRKNNEEVLNLVTNYTELSKFMIRNADGSLGISSEGWQYYEDLIQKRIDKLEILIAMQDYAVNEQTNKVLQQEYSNSAYPKHLSTSYFETTAYEGNKANYLSGYDQTQNIAEALTLEEEISELKFLGKTTNEILGLLEGRVDKEDIPAVLKEIEDFNESFRVNNEKQVEALVNMLIQDYETSDIDKTSGLNLISTDLAEQTVLSFLKDNIGDTVEKEINKEFTASYSSAGSNEAVLLKKAQKKLYEDFGLQMSDVGETVYNNLELLKEKLIALKIGEELSKDFENLLNNINNWVKNPENNLFNETGILPTNFIESYGKVKQGIASANDYEIIDEVINYFNNNEERQNEFLNLFNESVDSFSQAVETSKYDSAEKRREDRSKALQTGVNLDLINTNNEQIKRLNDDQYSSYTDLIGKMALIGSSEAANIFGETFINGILPYINNNDLSKIFDVFNDFDVGSFDSFEKLKVLFEELGYEIPLKELQSVIPQLQNFNLALKDISLPAALEKSTALRDVQESLKDDGEITIDQRNVLIEAGLFDEKDFFKTMDGYRLASIDIEIAVRDIGEAIVAAILEGKEADLAKEEQGQVFDDRIDKSNFSDEDKARIKSGGATDEELFYLYNQSSNVSFNQIPQLQLDAWREGSYAKDLEASGFKADPNADLTGFYTEKIYGKNLDELLNTKIGSFDYDELKMYKKALADLAEEEEGLANYIKIAESELKRQGKTVDKTSPEVIQLARDMQKAEEAQRNFNSSIEDNIEILRQGPDVKGYSAAIADVTEGMKGIFGSVVDESFVEENLSLILDFYNGVEGAQQELIAKLDSNWATAFDVPVENITNARDVIFDVIADIEENGNFSIQGQADLINIIENFLGVQDVMNMTAEEAVRVNEFLASMGANIQMKPFTSKYTWASLSELNALQSQGWMPTGQTRGTPPNFATGSLSSGNIEVELVKMSGGFTYTPTGGGSYVPGSSGGGPSGGVGGGGGDSTPSISEPSEMGENPYDKIYEITRKINDELRARQDLENQFNQGFEGSRYKAVSYEDEQGNIQWKFEEQENLGAIDRLKLLNEQEKSLLRQVALQQDLADAERESIRNLLKKNEALNNYVTFDENNELKINYDEIRKEQERLEQERERLLSTKPAENADKKTIENYNAEVEAYEEQKTLLEQILDQIAEIVEHESAALDAEDEQQNLASQYEELQEQGKQDWIDFLDRVLDAVIYERQKEIDELSNINDSINDTNSRILDGIQDQIDEQRKQRDNQKKETEIEEKQRRLDYLRQDTSNANDLAIKQLEQEIAEQQEDYTDTLIDQKISDLQDQNDAAAEQRERQIELMQSQLDWEIKNGELWDEVNRLIEEGIDKTTGEIKENSELFKMLQDAEGYKSLSGFAQSEWKKALVEQIISGLGWLYNKLDKNNDNDPFNDEQSEPGETVDFYDTKGRLKTGTFDEDGSIRLQNGDYTTEYSDFTRDMTGRYHAGAERTRFNATEANWGKDEEGNWIINDNEGKALKSQWISYKDEEYYMDEDGKLATGWQEIDDKWYYFDPTEGATQGALKTGWLENKGVWYYLDTEGANRGEMYTGEREIDGKIHMFDPISGAWLGEKPGANGGGGNGEDPEDPENPEDPETGEPKDNTATKEGWYEEDGKWYYGKDGKKLSGWQRLGTPWFYFDPSNGNAMVTGEHEINGVKYYFDENGYWLEDGQQPGTGDPVVDGSSLKVKAGELFDRDPNYYVRKSKSETSEELYNTRNIPDSEEIEILEKSGNWYKISSSLGTGWFSAAQLKGIKSAYHERMKAFKTGGLADFTGPAWLDGTKSRPELVLNQEDTQNFIKLKDVLSSFMDNVRTSNSGTKSNGGDNYFDIDISVDEIASDYDVDQLTEKIKKTIYEDSLYRNVNMLSFHR